MTILAAQVPARGEPQPGEVGRPLTTVATQPAFLVALTVGAIGYDVMILVMRASGFEMRPVTLIMQWHVLGMVAPSFVTSGLTVRFDISHIPLTGSALLIVSTVTAI